MENSVQPVRSRVFRSEEEMFKLIARRAASKLTVKKFCEQNDLLPAAYYYWQKKYYSKNESATELGGFTLLQVDDAVQQSLFAEVNGIKLYRAVSASFLKELLG
jgi:Transposase